jgi:cation diffusion facilitator family transporter
MAVSAAMIADRRRRKALAAWLSVVSNGAAVALKLVVALVTGSTAVFAEAAHSTSDLLASLVAAGTVRQADRPADRGHPFGHQKYEHVSGVVEGVLMLLAAAGVVVVAIVGLADGVTNSGLGIAVLVVTASANFVVGRFVGRVGRETESAALEADAKHLQADVVTSIGAAIALVAVAFTGWHEIDIAIGCAIAAWMAYTGARLIAGGTRVLVDETLPDAELQAIRDAIDAARPEIVGYHRLRARRAGAVRHVDVHVTVAPETTVARAHRLTDAIEQAVEARLPDADVVIHVEPTTHRLEPDAGLR